MLLFKQSNNKEDDLTTIAKTYGDSNGIINKYRHETYVF